jgi:hypothetical protein
MFDMQLLDRLELREKLLGCRQQRRVVSNPCDERPLTRNEQVALQDVSLHHEQVAVGVFHGYPSRLVGSLITANSHAKSSRYSALSHQR